MVQELRVGYHGPSSEATMYSDEIAIADEILSANKRLRERVVELHANTVALMLRYRRHRFPQFTGASDTNDEQRVRERLSDLVTKSTRPRSYVGYSRGSVCQACGNDIKVNDLEYDVVGDMSEIRLDAGCYERLIDQWRRVTDRTQ
jgi:hypothetical protein